MGVASAELAIGNKSQLNDRATGARTPNSETNNKQTIKMTPIDSWGTHWKLPGFIAAVLCCAVFVFPMDRFQHVLSGQTMGK